MASEIIPRLPVQIPAVNFRVLNKTAATTEVKAAACFSRLYLLSGPVLGYVDIRLP